MTGGQRPPEEITRGQPKASRRAWASSFKGQTTKGTVPDTNLYIGEIIQRFNLRNQTAAKPYTSKINEIKDYVETELVCEFEKYNMVFDFTELIKKGLITDHCLAEISEFGALLQRANENSAPIFALTDMQMKATGKVLEQMLTSKERFKKIFEDVANVVLELL